MDPGADMSDLPIIDEGALDRLSEWGGAELIERMIRIFLDHAPTRVAEIRSGVESGEIRETEKGAHSLKSSAGNLGAVRLRDVCARVEDLAADGELERAAALVDEVEERHREATDALTAVLEKLDPE